MDEVSLRQENKAALASTLRAAWEEAHGTPPGNVSVLVGPDSLAVLIKNAFSPAERAATQHAEGQRLVKHYAEQLFAIVEPDLRAQIEVAIGQRVTLVSVHADTAAGHVLCFYALGEPLAPPTPNSEMRSAP